MSANPRTFADRYTIATTDAGKDFILTKASTTVINALSQHHGRSYQDLSRITGLPVNTLMVYAQRMEGAGLVNRSQVMQRSRLRTLVFLAQGVSINYDTGRI